jgi:glycerol uptake facilitator-like aquaporin
LFEGVEREYTTAIVYKPTTFIGAISQLWLFWVAPIIGAVLGGLVYRFLGSNGE